ncbi:hypothetical protein Bbelb_063830 [Branchiostoma belcheri]|nr:hypothetical protein Bbelb_063830 [Branchiostoma belcheri]
MEIAYNTLVRPMLEYASVLLSNISTTAAKSLEQVSSQLLIPTTRDSRRQLNLRLRNDAHLHAPYCRTNTYGSSFVPYTTRLWNNLPKGVKEATSLLQFKQRSTVGSVTAGHSNILATRLRIGFAGCQLNSTLAKFNLTGRGCACGATSETVAAESHTFSCTAPCTQLHDKTLPQLCTAS